MRAEQVRQQLVADERLRLVAGQDEMGFEPEPRSCGGGHAAVVRLPGTDGDETISAGGERFSAQELELARLVAADAETGQIVSFDPQTWSVAEARTTLERRRQSGEHRPRNRCEPVQGHRFELYVVGQPNQRRASGVSVAVTVAFMDDVRVVSDLESLFRAHHGRLVRALTV